ncbi:uncharacterized protein PHACADRAFT_143785 [Phanerochaete carnosa HHB-10118-sp]|uniref:DUF726-domain-containing protein n=1 Tax=Phanerochaete carnosa (strain HHB-10118-sp) TaxID=650164 RepID=K5UZ58_PHACS|nr:uncharacterized protein PHACADRAFT_143785 [Phanerochaete carnosa HHB-10118-sp]EKM55446.1 hypothetical protein PHACADRAFT_143785 [Phanerochaete carnosa HHB-10118-sp]
MSQKHGDLTTVIPPTDLQAPQQRAIFEHVFRRLASHRNKAEIYATNECFLSARDRDVMETIREAHVTELNRWAQELLVHTWTACQEPGGGQCPTLDALADTSTIGLPALPDERHINQVLQTVLFLHLTAAKAYHAHTRTFISYFVHVDEDAVAATLKNPERAVKEAERKTKTQRAKEQHAARNKTLRRVGMGVAAVGGGVLIGITGGLAAPLVGAGVTTVLGWLGVGGTAAGLLASGLAGSSVVCGALFGAYGSKKSAETVGRFTKEVQDLAIIPVSQPRETLAVRLCVSGWLDSPEDVTAPWTVLDGDDTFALRWARLSYTSPRDVSLTSFAQEVEALTQLSDALTALVKTEAMRYVQAQIIKRTVFAALFAALSPAVWVKILRVIDNPWMSAKSLAAKAGRVLGTLLAQRVLGSRPVTLVGYSLGSLVIFEALQHLAKFSPSETQVAGLVQDVYLFGAPVPADEGAWAAARRVVSGRLINGYATRDYILAVLARASHMSWGMAGLQPVQVQGVENVDFTEEVDGHLKWCAMVGRCLQLCDAPGVVDLEVKAQLERRARKITATTEMSQSDAEKIIEAGPGDEPKMPPENLSRVK